MLMILTINKLPNIKKKLLKRSKCFQEFYNHKINKKINKLKQLLIT